MKILRVDSAIELRPILEKDVEIIFQTIDSNREHLGKWLPFIMNTLSVSDTETYIRSLGQNREEVFALWFNQTFIGLVSLKEIDQDGHRMQIGYWLAEAYQGKGLMIRAVCRLSIYAFTELDAHCIQIKCPVDNAESKNIPIRLKFELEGIEKDGKLMPDGTFSDAEVYTKLKQDEFPSHYITTI